MRLTLGAQDYKFAPTISFLPFKRCYASEPSILFSSFSELNLLLFFVFISSESCLDKPPPTKNIARAETMREFRTTVSIVRSCRWNAFNPFALTSEGSLRVVKKISSWRRINDDRGQWGFNNSCSTIHFLFLLENWSHRNYLSRQQYHPSLVHFQRCIQVFKLWGPLDPFWKKVLGVQLIYSQQDKINIR